MRFPLLQQAFQNRRVREPKAHEFDLPAAQRGHDFQKGPDEAADVSQRIVQTEGLTIAHLAIRAGAYVFCIQAGNSLDNKNFNNRVWAPLLRHLAFEHRRPYQMRHTGATLWLPSGEAPEWIARQLVTPPPKCCFVCIAGSFQTSPTKTARPSTACSRTRLLPAGAGAGAAAADRRLRYTGE